MKGLRAGRSEATLLFVYGTLMGGLNEAWQKLHRPKLLGKGTINARLYDFGDYPGAVVTAAGSRDRVAGELYEVRPGTNALRMLDEYEEFDPRRPRNSLFVRKRVQVKLEDGRTRKAWAYFYNRHVRGSRRIHSGDYRDQILVGPAREERAH